MKINTPPPRIDTFNWDTIICPLCGSAMGVVPGQYVYACGNCRDYAADSRAVAMERAKWRANLEALRKCALEVSVIVAEADNGRPIDGPTLQILRDALRGTEWERETLPVSKKMCSYCIRMCSASGCSISLEPFDNGTGFVCPNFVSNE